MVDLRFSLWYLTKRSVRFEPDSRSRKDRPEEWLEYSLLRALCSAKPSEPLEESTRVEMPQIEICTVGLVRRRKQQGYVPHKVVQALGFLLRSYHPTPK